LLLDRVEAVADGRLRHLRHQRLRVAQQQPLERAAPRELLPEHLRLHPEGVPGALHDGAVGHGVAAHEERDADQALATRHAHLGRGAVLHQVEERDDGGGGEIDVALPPAGLVDDLAEREGDAPEVRPEPLKLLLGEPGEQPIACRFNLSLRHE
jgi:hypothetical protein